MSDNSPLWCANDEPHPEHWSNPNGYADRGNYCSGRPESRAAAVSDYTELVAADLAELLTPKRIAAFWAKVEKTESCWIWRGSLNKFGYGDAKLGYSRHFRAHRLSWMLLRGPIPAGMQVHHECFNRACVNPDHLAVVTHAVNRQRLAGPQANNTTGYRGVLYRKATGRWTAVVRKDKVAHNFGTHDTAAEAADAARKGRIQLFGFDDDEPLPQDFRLPWESPIAGVVSDAIGGSTENAANVKPEGRE